jgi:hypothetical protein
MQGNFLWRLQQQRWMRLQPRRCNIAAKGLGQRLYALLRHLRVDG